MNLAEYRKAIALGVGLVLTGLLEYAATSTAQIEEALEAVVPAPLVPLVPILVGGLVSLAAVIKAKNDQPVSPASPTIEPPAPPVPDPVSATEGLSEWPAGTAPTVAADATPPVDETTAATAVEPVSTAGPFWVGVEPGAPQASTSLVELPPLPQRRTYL